MPRITMELLRKRSEHNEGEISTLEELSLHQENIEKIELLNQACRDLKILLLQYNLISKIENLNKLKRLEYLNLALNNIEVIENLEGLESLKKLDLMVNFIGDLRGVKTLRQNEHLELLILSGNPCCDYEGYRDYVLAALPQLRELDMRPVERSERIKALQRCAEAQDDCLRGYRKYAKVREAQKARWSHDDRGGGDGDGVVITEIDDEEKKDSNDEDDEFWSAPSHHTPEDRIAIAKKSMDKHKGSKFVEKTPQKYVPKLFSPAGKPYNINQPKVPFVLNDEDDRENIILDVGVYKHLDTSYVDVDVQPTYVRITIKDKILQLTLPSEVATDRSLAQRNTTTGHLLVTMPRLKPLARLSAHSASTQTRAKTTSIVRATPEVSKREFLEIGPPREEFWDTLRVVGKERDRKVARKVERDEEFVDDPSVPPLE